MFFSPKLKTARKYLLQNALANNLKLKNPFFILQIRT
jgi:hypothetical protein